MSTETALQTIEPKALATPEFSAFGNISNFEDAQRMAKALCSSAIVPDTYRGDQNLGSCVIALEISNRIGASVLAVMQNLYVIHGKPGWSSQFLISCVNASRKFSPLRYKMTGNKADDSWGCIAWATDKTGEALESPEVTIGMAKAEGWYQKNGSKWKTMPELMLRYRTATLFARLYAPELTMGIQTADEIQDIVDVESTVVSSTPIKLPSFGWPPVDLQRPPEPPRKRQAKPQPHDPTKTPEVAPEPPTVVVEAQKPVQDEDDLSFEAIVDGGQESAEVETLRRAILEAKIDDDPSVAEKKVVAVCVARKLIIEGRDPSLANIKGEKYAPLTKNIASGALLKEIKAAVVVV